jgi:prolyl-tRNA synthetase
MRQSKLFTKTRREAPKDEVSKNAQLLIRAGFIHKEIAGVYALLPMGLKVIKKIEQVIREEMNSIGGQEIEMTTLQSKELWVKAGKWSDDVVDCWFKTKLKNDTELGLAFSHEEAIVEMLKQHLSSYKDLPIYLYQFQTKFRNELRAKSGIMRGREFLMKDMYSFNRTLEELHQFYNEALEAYRRVFKRVGLGNLTYVTMADGKPFSNVSHEFQTLSDAGEDIIHINEKDGIAINDEVFEDRIKEQGLDRNDFSKAEKSIEVGNIFPIEDIIAKKMDFTYTDQEGKPQPIIMGSYGIGLGRLMGTVVEVLSDDKGIVWPKEIAPFDLHLIVLASGEGKGVHSYAEEIYMELENMGIEILYDDRDLRVGEKFGDADLIGIPIQVIVSEKLVGENKVEIKDRANGEVEIIEKSKLFDFLKKYGKQ